AAMRSSAGQARRFDLNGGGFGSQLNVMEDQFNGGTTVSDATRRIVKESLEGQGGNYVAGARKNAVEAFAPEMLDNLNDVVAKGDQVGVSRELAKLAGRYDAMASVAPENAEVLANKVLGQTLLSSTAMPEFTKSDGSQMTVREMIEHHRDNDDQFLN